MSIKRLIHVALATALLGAFGTANAATITTFSATIDGAQANAGMGTGSIGTGSATMMLDRDTNIFSWSISWQDLSGPPTAAHFHGAAAPGTNAGVQVGFDHTSNPSVGSATLTSEQITDLRAGLWYINIHTGENTGGEIRGQVTVIDSDIATFSSTIDGGQANAGMGTGSIGTGNATMTLDLNTNLFFWSISWQDLSGPPAAAHFHGAAAPGTNAGVQVGFDQTSNPSVGSATLTSEQITDLLAGLWYINIHTDENAGGEIRGQVTEIDSDGDGIGNSADLDDDGDGVPDDQDDFPLGRFDDARPLDFAFIFIEALARAGITSGCGSNNYCPDDSVTRAQMAVFLERGMRGSAYSPPAATGNTFLDVGAGNFAASFIEQLFLDGITAGCGGNNYCPNATVTRDQMAVFLLRAKHGSSYTPPQATGIFDDVPLGSFAVAWIEQLAVEGITAGCGGGNYCPEAPVNRDQMAVLLVRTFGL